MLDSGANNKHPENRIHLFDPVGLINDTYGGYRSSSYALRPPRRPAKSYESFMDHTDASGGLRTTFDSSSEENTNNGGVPRSDDSLTDSNNGSSKDTSGGLRFGVVTLEDESDVSTPRLWKPANHPPSPNQHNYQQNMSPSSRTQVIAKGRRDMMDMVRDLPESFYELSLKDIVDQKPSIEDKKEIDLPEEKKTIKETTNTKDQNDNNNNREGKKEKNKNKSSSKKVKKSGSKKKMVRSKSVDSGGFLLRTSVFPSFLGARKRKKSLSAASSFKIESKPKTQPAPTRSMKKGEEKEWWRRKSCISSESDQSNGLTSSSSSGSSICSNSINARQRNRFLRSFCLFNGKRIRGKA